MDKRLAIECIKFLEDVNFTEQIEDECTIGYISDNRYIDEGTKIEVQYLENGLGKYLALVYPIEKKSNAAKVSEYLTRWIINGRHEVLDDRILLCSIFPILDENLMGKQMRFALTEIWDMNNIARNTPE